VGVVIRRLLISLLVLGGLGAVVRTGTFATFTAQVTNPGNTFATGTLVLGNTKQGGTECLSTGGGNTNTNQNTSCDQLLNLTVQKPGQSGSANLTVKNEGSLPASVFGLFSTACTDSNATGQSYSGTGSPCGAVQLYIQQWSDSGFSTPLACLYGGSSGSTCNFSDSTKTLATFASTYNSSGSALTIKGDGTNNGLAAGASSYFTIAVQLPSTADNTLQGRQASIDFNWYVTQ
jgi:predicted ribosomally synthesized peptide with SipW-like signal peptide